MILFDSHAHYDDERFDEDRDQVIFALPDAGVKYVVNPAGDIDGGRRILALSERFPFFYAACGIHPHCAGQMTDADLDALRFSLTHPKAVALGGDRPGLPL